MKGLKVKSFICNNKRSFTYPTATGVWVDLLYNHVWIEVMCV